MTMPYHAIDSTRDAFACKHLPVTVKNNTQIVS
jgi:hypothetical protein